MIAAVLPAPPTGSRNLWVSPGTAHAIVAESHLDMTRFPSPARLASSARPCARLRQSPPRPPNPPRDTAATS